MIEPRRGVADRLLIAVFLIAIGLPATDTFFRIDPTPTDAELTPPSPTPRLARPISPGGVWRYYKSMKAHLAANFGFRRVLLQASNRVEQGIFGRFSTPDVVPGKEGWLVYNTNNLLVRAPRFRVEDLERWRSAIEWRRDWCRARGLPYLLVFAPNPQTVYPEILPDFLAHAPKPSGLDQLIPYLSERSDVEILDLRESMRNERSVGRLFHRTDTHWNELGAFIGYRAIMARLARWLPGQEVKTLQAFEIREESGIGGDLAGMIALRNVLGEEEIHLLPKTPPEAHAPDGGPIPYETICVKVHPIVEAEIARSTKPRAVMVRDSFGSALVPLLAEHFSRIVFSWRAYDNQDQPFPVEIIDREHPTVVIDEFAERTITVIPPKNPE